MDYLNGYSLCTYPKNLLLCFPIARYLSGSSYCNLMDSVRCTYSIHDYIPYPNLYHQLYYHYH